MCRPIPRPVVARGVALCMGMRNAESCPHTVIYVIYMYVCAGLICACTVSYSFYSYNNYYYTTMLSTLV